MAILLLGALAPAAIAIFLHPQLADRARAGMMPFEIRLEETAKWDDSILWVDARPLADYEAETILGAVHFDFDRFDEAIGELLLSWSPGRRVVVFCSSTNCETSATVANRLREAGLDDVYHLHGGWETWLAAH